MANFINNKEEGRPTTMADIMGIHSIAALSHLLGSTSLCSSKPLAEISPSIPLSEVNLLMLASPGTVELKVEDESTAVAHKAILMNE